MTVDVAASARQKEAQKQKEEELPKIAPLDLPPTLDRNTKIPIQFADGITRKVAFECHINNRRNDILGSIDQTLKSIDISLQAMANLMIKQHEEKINLETGDKGDENVEAGK